MTPEELVTKNIIELYTNFYEEHDKGNSEGKLELFLKEMYPHYIFDPEYIKYIEEKFILTKQNSKIYEKNP